MPVELTPKSHVDTPAWQSFELRMRARAAERRQAKRRRRLRRLRYGAMAVAALAFGMLSALGLRILEQRGALERALAPQPIVVQWPPAPEPPLSMKAAGIAPLPAPADWNPDAASLNPVPIPTGAAPVAEVEPPPPAAARAASMAPGETSDDAVFPEVERIRPGAETAGSVPAQQERRAPAEMAAAVPPAVPEPAPARTSPSAPPVVGTAGQNASLQPGAGTSLRSPSAEPALVSNRGNPLPEPSRGTDRPNPPPEPSGGTTRLPAAALSAEAGRNLPGEPATRTIDPRASVRAVLDRYRSAYQRLDASAARAVWPTVDAAALARAFGSLSSQEIRFDDCAIDVSGATADATCKGQARVAPKIGGGSETVRRTWQFKLRQAGPDWVIERATIK